jgi:hypothetical protein
MCKVILMLTFAFYITDYKLMTKYNNISESNIGQRNFCWIKGKIEKIRVKFVLTCL